VPRPKCVDPGVVNSGVVGAKVWQFLCHGLLLFFFGANMTFLKKIGYVSSCPNKN
jgi:hypothetical protein